MNLSVQRKIASNIKFLRRIFGYSQAELAAALGIARCTYAQLESGAKLPDIESISDLSAFYKISMDSILHLDIETLQQNMLSADRCRKNISRILEIYQALPPEDRRRLLEKARAVASDDESSRREN